MVPHLERKVLSSSLYFIKGPNWVHLYPLICAPIQKATFVFSIWHQFNLNPNFIFIIITFWWHTYKKVQIYWGIHKKLDPLSMVINHHHHLCGCHRKRSPTRCQTWEEEEEQQQQQHTPPETKLVLFACVYAF
jgi:hypothetical protein